MSVRAEKFVFSYSCALVIELVSVALKTPGGFSEVMTNASGELPCY